MRGSTKKMTRMRHYCEGMKTMPSNPAVKLYLYSDIPAIHYYIDNLIFRYIIMGLKIILAPCNRSSFASPPRTNESLEERKKQKSSVHAQGTGSRFSCSRTARRRPPPSSIFCGLPLIRSGGRRSGTSREGKRKRSP